MTDCLFCAIANGDIPAAIVSESDQVVVFRDVSPQAPVHVLAIPRKHVANVGDLAAEDPTLAIELLAAATQAAKDLGLVDGYRVVFNTGQDGGQSVNHVHAHVLGGRQLTWPPG
jgi:histidine triad (HIT) family protein